MEDGYLTLDRISSELDTLRGQSIFSGVRSHPALESYIAHQSTDEVFGFKKIILNHKNVSRKGIPYEVPKDYAFYVPFLPQLQQLLNCKDVLHCIDNPRPAPEGTYRSPTDGLFYRYNVLVLRHGNKVLCIIVYGDDVEFADPCKSKTKKHKIRIFYWTLGNLYPELRGKLQAINLIGMMKADVAKKHGNGVILDLFVNAVNKLSDGHEFDVLGVKRVFHGFIQFGAGDIPALANFGGFKESHFAKKPCRQCMVSRSEMCTHFKEDKSLLRNITKHNEYLLAVQRYNRTKTRVLMVDVDLDAENDMEADIVEEEDSDDPEVFQHEDPSGFSDDENDNPSVRYVINNMVYAYTFYLTKCLV